LGADRFVLLSGKDPGPALRSRAYQALERSMVELGDFARPFGIQIVLETFDSTVDKMALVGPSVEAAEFALRVRQKYPEFGLLYDMGHMPLLDETPGEALPVLRDVLAEVHLGNCVKTPGFPVSGDKHPRFGYADGVNNTPELVEFLQALFQVGYLGTTKPDQELPWVGFEIRPHGEETTGQILDNIQQTWQDAWETLMAGNFLN
jgi:sugar phosphate isomerase/epimerase